MPSSPRSFFFFYRGKRDRRKGRRKAKGRRNGERLRRNKTAMLHVDGRDKGASGGGEIVRARGERGRGGEPSRGALRVGRVRKENEKQIEVDRKENRARTASR